MNKHHLSFCYHYYLLSGYRKQSLLCVLETIIEVMIKTFANHTECHVDVS